MNRATQFSAVLLLLVLILGLVEAQFHFLRYFLHGGPLEQREVATRYLGEYLAGHYAGKKALVFSNPFCEQPGQPPQVYRFEKAGLRGLRRGMGSAIQIEQVVLPEIRPEFFKNPRSVHIDPSTTTPLSYLVTDDSLDRFAKQHPDAELLISLIGLPLHVQETETWKPENPRKFALLLPDLRLLGSQAAIRQAVRSGKIAALVLDKPGAPPEDQPLGKDLKMEFEQRFLLVTPDTVDRYMQTYPRLF